MNILVELNHGFVRQTATMLYSLRKNTPSSEVLNVYFAHFDNVAFSSEELVMLKSGLAETDRFTDITVPQINIKQDPNLRWSIEIFLKLFALYCLPSSIDRLLHLDGDVIVRGDIDKFYSSSLLNDEIYFLGTKECHLWQQEKIKEKGLKSGIDLNVGVLLINVKQFVKTLPTVDELTKSINSVIDRCYAPEQDYINIVFDDHKACWPSTKYGHLHDPERQADKSYIDPNPVIIHYAGFEKPWNEVGLLPYRRLFWKYGKHYFSIMFRINLFFKRIWWIIKQIFVKLFK